MKKLLEHCDSLTKKILSQEPFVEELQIFLGELSDFIKKIYEIYSRPEYASHLSDIPAWIEQLKRLQNAVALNDTFFLLDVISYEIKENLLEAQNILGGQYGN